MCVYVCVWVYVSLAGTHTDRTLYAHTATLRIRWMSRHPREVILETIYFDDRVARPLGAAPFGSTIPHMGGPGRRRLLQERIVGLFAADSPFPALVTRAGHPGLATLDVARATVSGAVDRCDQRAPVVAEHLRTMTRCIEALGGAVGGAERINGTPLPVVYV